MTTAANSVALLLAAENMTFVEVLWFLVTGLSVVLATLSVLALFCVAMGAAFQQAAARAKVAEKPTAPRPAVENEVPEEIAAVIAAAVAVAVEGAHRIVHIGAVTDAWALERRFQHHASHKVPKRNPN